jgi:hypothetical protein
MSALLKEMTEEMKKSLAGVGMSKEEFKKKFGGQLVAAKNGFWMPGGGVAPVKIVVGKVGMGKENGLGMGKGLGEEKGKGKGKGEEEDIGVEDWELDYAWEMFLAGDMFVLLSSSHAPFPFDQHTILTFLSTPESLSDASSPSTSPTSFQASSSTTPGPMNKRHEEILAKIKTMGHKLEAVRAQIWECRESVDGLLDGVRGKGKEVIKEEKMGDEETVGKEMTEQKETKAEQKFW